MENYTFLIQLHNFSLLIKWLRRAEFWLILKFTWKTGAYMVLVGGEVCERKEERETEGEIKRETETERLIDWVLQQGLDQTGAKNMGHNFFTQVGSR